MYFESPCVKALSMRIKYVVMENEKKEESFVILCVLT